ncbi:hypothetical protein H6F86_21030 [Phormidium sp. FACHB-592]|uniref:Uncharacterized protein n=1 Tax=Stenomitos frigidus AS-A4 TaxID=2933935 RepID=A0ABV0KEP6_9CYAN|nr:hypothetical protein [Phormidium sp. FACHB-592]MBD2076319.1 hypothetical protein [Phormidium sp. FACHB-592]
MTNEQALLLYKSHRSAKTSPYLQASSVQFIRTELRALETIYGFPTMQIKTIAPIQTPLGTAEYLSESDPDRNGISQVTVRYPNGTTATYSSNEVELREVWVERTVQNVWTLEGQLSAIAAASANSHELAEQYEAHNLI